MAEKVLKQKAGKTIVQLVSVAVLMFGFGFAMVPLYDLICDVTGLNGKTGSRYVSDDTESVDEDRLVTIQFLTNNNASMPWEFRPEKRSMKVHPGKLSEVSFYVRNLTDRTMMAQAVPSVSPNRIAEYLHKTECFCFEQQQLAEGEDLDMPLRFIIDDNLPKDVTTLTLSYTLYDITDLMGTLASVP